MRKVFLFCTILLLLVGIVAVTSAEESGDDESTVPPYVDLVNETGVSETFGDSWVTTITIDDGYNFDTYAWWDDDILGLSLWEPEHVPVTKINSVTVQVVAWDVDNPNGVPPPTSYETDLVYLNWLDLGVLKGSGNSWSTTTFTLSQAEIDLVFGPLPVYSLPLDVFIDVDSQHISDHWAVTVDKVIITIEYETVPVENLLKEYSPVLYLHPDELYQPKVIDSMLNRADLKIFPIGYIIDPRPVSLGSLEDRTSNHYLDLVNAEPDPFPQIPSPSDFVAYSNNVYGRQTEVGNYIVLQYWFFYPYNNWHNNHEGDWEVVQILLDKTTKDPESATYSFHLGGKTYGWNELEKVGGTHPKVYVTKGGHGNWASSGSHRHGFGFFPLSSRCVLTSPPDYTSSAGLDLSIDTDYSLDEISDSTSWVDFKGLWGKKVSIRGFNGPLSPKYKQSSRIWDSPLFWASNPETSGYGACTGSPVILHVYDSEGNHIGLNEIGEVEWNIDNTYLYLSEEDYNFAGIASREDLLFKVEAIAEGEFNLTISKYDEIELTDFIIDYNNVEITEDTIATVDVTVTNPNFVMKVDLDGDGKTDIVKLPDNMTIIGEYIFPEPDTDLDGVSDSADNCPYDFNPDQEDFDQDGLGDVCDTDDDNDDVLDIEDKCQFTVLPEEVPMVYLKPKHYADIDGDGYFEGINPKNNEIVDNAISFSETYGCSCYEILNFMPEINEDQLDYGCSKGTINVFSKLIGWTRILFG